ncbi:MAG: peptidase M15 [Alphaproteobacteria bacterium]|nr:MAG: peptidase M15 [Alphaproteobacteria bacterium]
MRRASRPANGLRTAICALTAAITLVAAGTDPADARGRRWRHHHHARAAAYNPPYAAIVVDANSGRVLHETNPDSLRHPASLTKIMTLYLLFEQVEAGKLRLDSRLEVSEHAAGQAPSKLGLVPGQTIAVDDAIRALVTKSANDAAVVVAEAIGGDEDSFARMMTRKARALGMSRTVYANASGLPDDDQITTARDQATLGRAIQDRFPRYYRYFATPAFVYRGHAMRNHNKLLGRVEGVDGIKTGYTRASGFNLVSSVRRGNRHIVAVVLGGASGGARDARMRMLIEQQIASAATQRSVARIEESREIAAVAPKAPEPVAQPQPLAPPRLARADAMPAIAQFVAPAEAAPAAAESQTAAVLAATALSRQPKPGSGEPINPVKVKTITVKAGNVQTAMLVPLTAPAPQATVAPPHFAKTTAVAEPAPPQAVAAKPASYELASASSVPVTTASMALRLPHPRGAWMIQVGAFPKETEAQERLREAQMLARQFVARAEPFTERVTKGSQELYRARFAGFDQDSAEAACRYFKRNEIACLTIRN